MNYERLILGSPDDYGHDAPVLTAYTSEAYMGTCAPLRGQPLTSEVIPTTYSCPGSYEIAVASPFDLSCAASVVGGAAPHVDRTWLVATFAAVVGSFEMLPPDAEEIIDQMRRFVLKHPFTVTPNTTLPLRAHTPHRPIIGGTESYTPPDNSLLPQGTDTDICLWNNCQAVLESATNAAITRHLLTYHFSEWRRDWEVCEVKTRCMWTGCQTRRCMKKRSLAKHIATAHLRSTEVECEVPECVEMFSRGDAMKRHMKLVHGV